MHAVLISVAIQDRQRAEKFLHEEVVPRVSQAPGFVAGYWMNVGETRGTAVMVFDSQEDARRVAEQPVRPPAEAATVQSVEVAEVVAHV